MLLSSITGLQLCRLLDLYFSLISYTIFCSLVFKQAIRQLTQGGFVHFSAIANELAAKRMIEANDDYWYDLWTIMIISHWYYTLLYVLILWNFASSALLFPSFDSSRLQGWVLSYSSRREICGVGGCCESPRHEKALSHRCWEGPEYRKGSIGCRLQSARKFSIWLERRLLSGSEPLLSHRFFEGFCHYWLSSGSVIHYCRLDQSFCVYHCWECLETLSRKLTLGESQRSSLTSRA